MVGQFVGHVVGHHAIAPAGLGLAQQVLGPLQRLVHRFGRPIGGDAGREGHLEAGTIAPVERLGQVQPQAFNPFPRQVDWRVG